VRNHMETSSRTGQ